MDHALAHFGTDVGIAFSGAEDVALIEYAKLTGRPFRVFSLDTGRLNPETYKLFDAVEKHYGIHIEYTFPESKEVTDLVRAKGLFSFYTDGHNECCKIRKASDSPKHILSFDFKHSDPARNKAGVDRPAILFHAFEACEIKPEIDYLPSIVLVFGMSLEGQTVHIYPSQLTPSVFSLPLRFSPSAVTSRPSRLGSLVSARIRALALETPSPWSKSTLPLKVLLVALAPSSSTTPSPTSPPRKSGTS